MYCHFCVLVEELTLIQLMHGRGSTYMGFSLISIKAQLLLLCHEPVCLSCCPGQILHGILCGTRRQARTTQEANL